jgi:hypothetical protein
MTFFRVRCFRRGGETECGGLGSRCLIRVRSPEQAALEKREDFFIHTVMTEEERENIHDNTR